MKSIQLLSLVLIVVGGLNWGLVGAADFNLVSFLFGPSSWISRIVYLLVGLSALYQAVEFARARQRAMAASEA